MPTNDISPGTKRRNLILALVHVVLVIVILGAFVYVQSKK
jgi:hypothetical protein